MEDYYKILEVSPEASEEVIKMAYKALAKKYHPDEGGKNAPVDKMKTINQAFAVLGNPDKRAAYDSAFLGHEKQARNFEPSNREEKKPCRKRIKPIRTGIGLGLQES